MTMGTTIVLSIAAVLIVAVICATIVLLEAMSDGVADEWMDFLKEMELIKRGKEVRDDGRAEA